MSDDMTLEQAITLHVVNRCEAMLLGSLPRLIDALARHSGSLSEDSKVYVGRCVAEHERGQQHADLIAELATLNAKWVMDGLSEKFITETAKKQVDEWMGAP